MEDKIKINFLKGNGFDSLDVRFAQSLKKPGISMDLLSNAVKKLEAIYFLEDNNIPKEKKGAINLALLNIEQYIENYKDSYCKNKAEMSVGYLIYINKMYF